MEPRRIQRGQRLSGIPEGGWNGFVWTYEQMKQLRQAGAGTGASDGATRITCLVKNTTGADIADPFPVLELIQPHFTTADSSEVVRRDITIDGDTPGVGVGINEVAIVQGPIPAGEYREAVIFGPTWVKLFVLDEAHTHAIPKDNDHTQLTTSDGSTGGVPIVWQEGGLGTVWACVIMGECCGGSGGGGTCVISVGCGLEIVDNVLRLDADLLAGAGIIIASDCTLDVNTGDGLELSVGGQVQTKLERGLSFTTTTRAIELDLGCGLEFSGNQARVKRADLIGLGLEGDTGTCNLRLKLNPTSSCLILDSNGLRVDSACLVGGSVTTGCGLEFDSGDLRVKASDLAADGLVTSGECGIAVGQGCGITVTSDAVAVKRSDLIGPGLENGLGACNLQVKLGSCLVFDINGAVAVDSACLAGGTVTPGCGLEFFDGDLRVKNTDLAGLGLVPSGVCGLDFNPGCGLEFSGDFVRIKRADLAGLGLEAGSGACDLKIKLASSSCLILDANGLKVDSACLVGDTITPGCGLEFFDGDLRVKNADLAGPGLIVDSTCGIAVGAGCGITVSDNAVAFKPSEVAGDGLVTGTGCTVNVGQGCGISVSADAVAVNRSDLIGQGLEADSGTCNLKVKLGSCLQFDGTGAVAVDSACLVGDTITTGCGLEFDLGALRIKNTDLAAEGLVTSGECGVAVGQGCGITVTANAVAVNSSALAGNGLITGSGCTVNVGAGCGITVTPDTVAVNRTALIGQGLEAGPGTCDLKVKLGSCLVFDGTGAIAVDGACVGSALTAGCGISIVDNVVSVNADTLAGTGLAVSSGCTLAVNPGCGLKFNGDQVAVNSSDLLGNGLTTSGTACGLALNIGCGLEFNGAQVRIAAAAIAGDGLGIESACAGAGTALKVNAGCGIQVIDDAVGVKATDVAGAGLVPVGGSSCAINVGQGCGITVTADSIEVNHTALAGAGLSAGANCQLDVNVGCGLSINVSDQIQVNGSALAGSGLLAEGPCGVAVGQGCGIVVGTDNISVNAATLAGAGLFSTLPCGINVGQGCGITVTSDTVSVNRTALMGQGLEADTGTCNMRVKLGSCLQFDANNAIAVNPSCLGSALTAGCGISIDGSTISFDATPIAGLGLTTGTACSGAGIGLKVNTGCGLEIIDDKVQVRNTDIAGFGLVAASGSCGLNVNVGCGLQLDAITHAVKIKPSDILGNGLTTSGVCGLALNIGCGLEFNGAQVRVRGSDLAGTGLTTETACGGFGTALRVNTGCGIQIIDDAVWVKPTDIAGNGLSAVGGSSCAIQVNTGCGLEILPATDTVSVKASDLVGTASITGLRTAGPCGITFDKTTANEYTVNSLNSCQLVRNGDFLELRLNVTPFVFRRNAALIPTLISPGTPINLTPCQYPLKACP